MRYIAQERAIRLEKRYKSKVPKFYFFVACLLSVISFVLYLRYSISCIFGFLYVVIYATSLLPEENSLRTGFIYL